MNRPYLSICIPTFNRSAYLQQTLNSLVIQNIFIETNEVEIIVSDNCSSDDTEIIVNEFILRFPDKIIYNKNTNNIIDDNFYKVLSLGNGHYLKLNNDTLIHNDNSLNHMLSVIKNNIQIKPILFFTSGCRKFYNLKKCNNQTEFVNFISFYTTWIGMFGIWKSQLDKQGSFFSNTKTTNLKQTELIFHLINTTKNPILIDDALICKTIKNIKKGGYNFTEVFLINYSFLLREQVAIGKLSNKTYKLEMKKVLLNQLSFWLVDIKLNKNQFNFTDKSSTKIINKFYKNRPYLLFLFYLKSTSYFIYKLYKKLIKN